MGNYSVGRSLLRVIVSLLVAFLRCSLYRKAHEVADYRFGLPLLFPVVHHDERREQQRFAELVREFVRHRGVPEYRTHLATLPETSRLIGEQLLARAIAAEGKGPHFLGQPEFKRAFPVAAQLLEVRSVP